MKFVLVLLAAVAVNTELQLVSEWNTFKKQYNKQYKPMEDVLRKNNYYRNKERIVAHNYLFTQGVYTYKLGLNQFADWTEHDFNGIFRSGQYSAFTHMDTTNRWIGTTTAPSHSPTRPRRPGATAVPETTQPPTTTETPLWIPYRPELGISENYYMWFDRKKRQTASHLARDWRLEEAVNPIRDQTVMGKSQCNAGWAFAAIAVMEGHDSKYPSGLQQFSEQNLLDCIAKEIGCSGMTPKNAFQYIEDKGNINPLKKYPYKGNAGGCQYDEEDYGTAGIKAVSLSPMNEDQLLDVVAEVGPVAVGFDPHSFSFMFYSSGVYNERKCQQGIGNQVHYMTVVGFDEDPELGKFWIARNSFGSVWGESGYMRVSMGQNICGIAYQPTYMLV